MKKKLIVVSLAGILALEGITAVGVATGGGQLKLANASDSHAGHDKNGGEEKAFYAPGTYKEGTETFDVGFKPYWRCDKCCSSAGPNSARYSLDDKTTLLSYPQVEIPALKKVQSSAIASGDEIANVNTGEFKYVDQGANGVSGKEGASTPWFVSDSNKTAVYFSASGKTGAATNPTSDDNCAEFRFSTDAKRIKSVSFDYCYKNWGTGTWNGDVGKAEPSKGWKSLLQFQTTKDGVSNDYGVAADSILEDDGTWHSAKVAYNNTTYWASSTFDNFTSFIFKFADLRGYIMISNLTYEIDDSTSNKIVDSNTGKEYADLKSALSNVTSGTLSLRSDLSADELSDENLVTIAGDKDITIDLNGHNIDLRLDGENKTAEGYSAKRFEVYGKLNITGNGSIIGSDDTLFQVYGQYYAFNYNTSTSTLTRSKLLGTAGKLNVGKGVTLKGDYKSIAIMDNPERALTLNADETAFIEKTYKNGSSDGSSDFIANNKKGDDYGFGIGYARNAEVNFSGTDATPEGFYVGNSIRDKGYYPLGDTKVTYNDNASLPTINIDGATIKSGSYIAGYVNLNVKNSAFKGVHGTAFNIESGNVLFENNTFDIEIGVVGDRELYIKEPDYFDVNVDGNATIYLNQGVKYSPCIDKAIIDGNTFKTVDTSKNDATKLAAWKDVATFWNDEINLYASDAKVVKASELKASSKDGTSVGEVTKMSEMNYRVAITATKDEKASTFYAYFKDEAKAKSFNTKFGDQILKNYGMTDVGTLSGHSLEARTSGTTTWAAVV